ncbi:MAG: RNA-binding S4 domain-containing protein [Alphaproteobacteria bacterium]|nr:RNA-binding S4 domain-containing protein [Alphaproteobacteria bacterium]
MRGSGTPGPTSRRLDQWLWFARFANSRSLASRLCTAGAIILNGVVVSKARHLIRVGDIIVVPQGVLSRTIRVKALGWRRGPSIEARLLYEEAAPAAVLDLYSPWKPLLADN